MQKLGRILQWVAFGFFVLVGIVLLSEGDNLASGIIFLLGGSYFIINLREKIISQKYDSWYIKIGVFILVLVVGSLFSNIESIEKEVRDKVEESEITIDTPQKKLSESKNTIQIPEYNIFRTDDISIGNADRYSVHVVMRIDDSSENNIKQVAQKIITKYADEGSDATAIFFYMHESEVDHGYTLAKAEWAPNGVWSDAHLKKNYQTVYDFKKYVGQKDVSEPSEEEREITKQIRDLYYKMNETGEFVTEDEVYKILAPKLDKTVEELEEIHWKVTSFEMGY